MGIGVLLVILMIFPWTDSRAPTESESVGSWTTDGMSDKVPGYENPDKYLEYHAAIRQAEDSPDYPPNYRMEAFENAISARKRSGKKLAWVERGPANAPGRTRAVLVDPDDPTHRTWYAGSVGGGLWKTTNAGSSWQSLTGHLPNLAVSALAMPESNPDIIYMGTGEGFPIGPAISGSGIFKSMDRGRTWTQLKETAYNPAFRWVNRMAVNPDDGNIIVAATSQGIFKSTDGGVSWIKTYPSQKLNPTVYDLKASPDDFNVQFATEYWGPVLRSLDGGSTWSVSLLDDFFSPDNQRMELAVSPFHPGTVYLSTFTSWPFGRSHLYRTNNYGDSWDFIMEHTGPDGGHWIERAGNYNQALAIHPYDVNKVFLGGVQFWEATISPTANRTRYLSSYELINMEFAWQVFWRSFNYFENTMLSGDGWSEVPDVTPEDFVSVEVRFGPGKRQKAHRFSVAQTGANQFGDAESFYSYEDYTDVPFEVWDIDNNTQLMVSFRDDKGDGEFDLGRGAGDKEHIFIHGYPLRRFRCRSTNR